MKNNRLFIYLLFFIGGGVCFFLLKIFNSSQISLKIILNSIVGGITFILFFFFYIKTHRYVKECFFDLINKVTWPSWKELQNSSIVVAVASLLIAGIIYLMDSVFSRSLDIFYNLVS